MKGWVQLSEDSKWNVTGMILVQCRGGHDVGYLKSNNTYVM